MKLPDLREDLGLTEPLTPEQRQEFLRAIYEISDCIYLGDEHDYSLSPTERTEDA